MPASAPIWVVYLMLGGARLVEEGRRGEARERVVNGIVGVVLGWGW